MCLYLCDFLHSSNSAVTPDVASVVLLNVHSTSRD